MSHRGGLAGARDRPPGAGAGKIRRGSPGGASRRDAAQRIPLPGAPIGTGAGAASPSGPILPVRSASADSSRGVVVVVSPARSEARSSPSSGWIFPVGAASPDPSRRIVIVIAPVPSEARPAPRSGRVPPVGARAAEAPRWVPGSRDSGAAQDDDGRDAQNQFFHKCLPVVVCHSLIVNLCMTHTTGPGGSGCGSPKKKFEPGKAVQIHPGDPSHPG